MVWPAAGDNPILRDSLVNIFFDDAGDREIIVSNFYLRHWSVGINCEGLFDHFQFNAC